MKYIISATIIFLSINCFGQKLGDRKIKEKRTYKDSVLLSVSRFDTLGNSTFWYSNQYVSKNWNGNYITMVGASKYDDANNKTLWISGHSNVGFSIYYPEKQNDSTEFNYSIKDGYDKMADMTNKNQFGYIKDIKTYEQLMSHEQIKNMFQNGKKRLNSIVIKDKNGNSIKEFGINREGDTTSVKTSRFDENNKETYFYYNPSFGEWEIHFKHDKNGNRLSSKRVPYKRDENALQKLDTTEVSLYKYDDHSNLLELIRSNKGELSEKNSFIYNDNNQLIEKKSYIETENNLVVIETYKYKNDVLIEVKRTDLRKKNAEPEITTYEYDFYE